MPATTVRKGWLPREGFTADVVQGIIQKTILNPALTLPLFLLAHYARKGEFAVNHELAVKRLKICLYLGLARWVNNYLSQGALNNWQSDRLDWPKELVVITGGSDGIGKHLVNLLASQNVKIIILDIQPPTYELPNDQVHYVHLDLTSPEAIHSASDLIRTKHGNPTILILNAGIANRRSLLSTPDGALSALFAINTLSHFRLAREFLPAMVAANHGTVVTIASLAGYVTVPGLVDYCSSKASAVAFHEGVAAELRYRYRAPKVRTVCVCPNFVATKLSEGFLNKSWFLSPTLRVETVAEAVFEKIVSGDSGTVVLPRTHGWLAMTMRALPWWWQVGMGREMRYIMEGPERVQMELDREVKARGERAEDEGDGKRADLAEDYDGSGVEGDVGEDEDVAEVDSRAGQLNGVKRGAW